MSLPRSLLARLFHDLNELLESPYPGIAVFTDDADIQKLCLVLTPPSGPWKDLSLHFDVKLPNNWPSSPPKVQSSVSGIEHPNLFGTYICCDLLKEQSELEKGYTGGYSPALTLRGLFLQFLTFFSSTKIEQDSGDYSVIIGDYIIVSYTRNPDLKSSDVEADNRWQAQNRISVAPKNDHNELERLWRSSASPEYTIDDSKPSFGPKTTHTVKAVAGEIDRVHRFEQINPRWEPTRQLISTWRCERCPYGSRELPVYRIRSGDIMDCDQPPVSTLLVPPPTCLFENFPDDTLMDLSEHMPSESLSAFSTAYPRFKNLLASMRVLLQRELRCFFLRTSLRDSVLGIGVAFDPKPRTLSSDFDWLSMEAFKSYNVRTSIQKRSFQYFLPLALSPPHFERVRGEIWTHLTILDEAVREAEIAIISRTGRPSNRQIAPPAQPHHTVGVIYKMMNNIVVSLMKSCDSMLDFAPRDGRPQRATILHASEKALISYCHLFHLLLCLSRSTPAIRQDAVDRLKLFIQVPQSREKTRVPDLGELIILITLVLARPLTDSTPITWAMLNGPFIEEAMIRNVRWTLKDIPDLEVMEIGASDYRLEKTFLKSKTSLRLIMFQITFLDIFIKTYASNISQLDNSYGFPEPHIPERMVEEIKEVYKVNSWPDFFRRIHFARGVQFGKEKLSELLRTAVAASANRKYHEPKMSEILDKLTIERQSLERNWEKTRR